ncbi:hypothetical protein Q0M94_20415 (plasmid) [Deinococcus radiomollis]|uniref:hypothetical protein n=1 Tax=Deinococcus radiomollis TaxID=468916 RepID=UPI003892C4EA
MRSIQLPDLQRLRTALAQSDALDAARFAARLQPDLGRALLARTGGLLDTAEALSVLGEPLRAPLSAELQAALEEIPAPPGEPGRREVWVRGVAALLLSPLAPSAEALPLPPENAEPLPLLATLSLPDAATRWTLGIDGALSRAGHTGQTRVTLAVGSWGAWLSARQLLSERYGAAVGGLESPIAVIMLEDAVNLLAAAWSWNISELADLLGGPLLLDGVEGLLPSHQSLVFDLTADVAEVFGVSVLLMGPAGVNAPGWSPLSPPGVTKERVAGEQTSTDGFGQDHASAHGSGAAPAVPEFPAVTSRSLNELAQTVSSGTEHTLVVLPSRGSAARLAALLPGSALWSSSLCPVHLGDLFLELKRKREAGARLVVVATSLPPAQLGPFDTVWHMDAPLPYLAEAWSFCAGSFRRLLFSDVALPSGWLPSMTLTHELLEHATPDQALNAYLRYSQDAPLPPGPSLHRLRDAQDYASLASALRLRPATSRPALVPYDAQARALAEAAEYSGHLPTSALRYAAWMTTTEAAVAIRQGHARSIGWALLWEAEYDLTYGLAGKMINETIHANSS